MQEQWNFNRNFNLNSNYLDQNNHCEIAQNLKLQGLNKMIEMATRTTEYHETLIDKVLTNHPKKIVKSHIIASEVSDHDIIACQRNVNNIKYKPKIIKCRNYVNYNHNVVHDQLRNTDWTKFYQLTDPNQSWISLKTMLLSVLKQCIHNIKEC